MNPRSSLSAGSTPNAGVVEGASTAYGVPRSGNPMIHTEPLNVANETVLGSAAQARTSSIAFSGRTRDGSAHPTRRSVCHACVQPATIDRGVSKLAAPHLEPVVTSDATEVAFDAIVIGAGQAGPGIAYHLVSTGRRVALVEADKVGGTCLNRGCRPTKALRASARVAHLARTASRHGVHTGEVTVDFAAVMARKDALIDGWVNEQAESLGHTDGLTLLYGEARFVGRSDAAFEIAVGSATLTAAEVFLNVGTRATKPSIPGLDDVAWLDNDSVLHLRQLPAHLVILGGSYIGLEIGQLFGRFGSAVTVIERGTDGSRAEKTPKSPPRSPAS